MTLAANIAALRALPKMERLAKAHKLRGIAGQLIFEEEISQHDMTLAFDALCQLADMLEDGE